MNEPSDDEIIAQWKASTRAMWRLVWILTGGLTLVVGVIAAALLTGHAELVMSFWGQVAFAVWLAVLFAITFVGIAKYYKPPPEIANPRLVRRLIDAYQRRWRWIILLGIFITFVSLRNLTNFFRDAPAPQSIADVLITASIIVAVTMFVLVLAAGPGWQGMGEPGMSEILNDEFVQSLRARTMRFGYIVAMLLISAVLLIAVWRPDLTLKALCWSMFAGYALPALYYVIADWRASRANEGRDG
jgi:hypothetical protein